MIYSSHPVWKYLPRSLLPSALIEIGYLGVVLQIVLLNIATLSVSIFDSSSIVHEIAELADIRPDQNGGLWLEAFLPRLKDFLQAAAP